VDRPVAEFRVIPVTIPLLFVIGSEFMPPLYEGSMLYMPTSPPGMSITEATRLLQVQDRLLRRVPEVQQVFGTVGRGNSPTDNSPMGMVNTTVVLKPREEWRARMTFERLQAEMDATAAVSGFSERVDAAGSQPARHAAHRHRDAGRDQDFRHPSRRHPGIGQEVERVSQRYFTDIRIDRQAIARHGLTIEDVQDVIQSALGGENITQTVEGRERYPVNVRYAREFRDNLPALERVLVKTPGGPAFRSASSRKCR
jgi:Cu(I)/Ag(I) efflux system membrane protein CusA/SilA